MEKKSYFATVIAEDVEMAFNNNTLVCQCFKQIPQNESSSDDVTYRDGVRTNGIHQIVNDLTIRCKAKKQCLRRKHPELG